MRDLPEDQCLPEDQRGSITVFIPSRLGQTGPHDWGIMPEALQVW